MYFLVVYIIHFTASRKNFPCKQKKHVYRHVSYCCLNHLEEVPTHSPAYAVQTRAGDWKGSNCYGEVHGVGWCGIHSQSNFVYLATGA